MKFPVNAINVVRIELEPSPWQFSGCLLFNFDVVFWDVGSETFYDSLSELWIEEDNLYVGIVDPCDFAYVSFGALDRSGKHLTDLPSFHKVHSMHNQSNGKRLGFFTTVVWLQP